MEAKKNIYYGILLAFLYTTIYAFFVDIVAYFIAVLHVNIWVLPAVLGIIGLAMLLLFWKNNFPPIKLWLLIMIAIAIPLLSNFLAPTTLYEDNHKWFALNVTVKCRSIFQWLIVIIACIKYYKRVSGEADS